MSRNVWCVATSKDKARKTIVSVFPIKLDNDNLAGRFNNYEIVRPCETKEMAYRTAEYWDYKYKQKESECCSRVD